MRRSDDSLAACLLSSHLEKSSVEPLSPGEFWALLELVGDRPGILLSAIDEVVESAATEASLAFDRLHQLLDRGTALSFEIEALEQQGITLITPFDPGYPARLRERLGSGAPPVIYLAGNAELLDNQGLGIVGSRAVTAEAEEVAIRAAALGGENGITVVSGGAKGIDQIAMRAAFDADGQVVGVLADSLVQKLRDPGNRQAIFDGRACLLTLHKPTLGFTVGNAMARNKVIYALSACTLVVRSDRESGGTWAGASEALRRGYGSLAVWQGAGSGPGNELLVRRGAHPISSLEELFDDGRLLDFGQRPDSEQLALELSTD